MGTTGLAVTTGWGTRTARSDRLIEGNTSAAIVVGSRTREPIGRIDKQLRLAKRTYCAAIDDDLYMNALVLALGRMFGVRFGQETVVCGERSMCRCLNQHPSWRAQNPRRSSSVLLGGRLRRVAACRSAHRRLPSRCLRHARVVSKASRRLATRYGRAPAQGLQPAADRTAKTPQ